MSSNADLTTLTAFPVLRFFMDVAGLKGSTDTSTPFESCGACEASFSFCLLVVGAFTIED